MNYLPGIILIFFVALIIAFITHLWRGGNIFRLGLLIGFAILGFIVGQWIGGAANSKFILIGWVQMGWGITFSIIGSLVGAWLTEIKKEE